MLQCELFYPSFTTGNVVHVCCHFIGPCLQGTVMDLMVTQQSIWHTCASVAYQGEATDKYGVQLVCVCVLCVCVCDVDVVHAQA